MPALSSLTQSLQQKLNRRKADAYLIECEYNGQPAITAGEGAANKLAFQYWPESLQDNKATNYLNREIPGGTLPLYQFIAGGERSLSFTAVFTTDVDHTLSSDIPEKLNSTGVARRNVDIRAALTWLRSFVYPAAGKKETTTVIGGKSTSSQMRKLRLVMPNSGIGLIGMDAANHDSVLVIMTQCEITVDAWFPSGLPRVATANLTFVQTAQANGDVQFPIYSREVSNIVGKTVPGSDAESQKNLGYTLSPVAPKKTFPYG